MTLCCHCSFCCRALDYSASCDSHVAVAGSHKIYCWKTYSNNKDVIGHIEFTACELIAVASEGLAVAAGDALAHRVHIHTLSLQVVALHPALCSSSMPAGVVCSFPIVGSALGELKLVLKSRGKVFFMEQVLAPDPDRKLRPYRLIILKPLQQANSDSCHWIE